MLIFVGVFTRCIYKEVCVFLKCGNVVLLEGQEQRQRYIKLQRQKRGDMSMSGKSETILIGRKPAMNYVLAIVTSLSASDNKEITIKARGRAITTAVDVAEIVRNRFLKDLKVSKISIGTEEMPPKQGQNRSRMVSTMEITLTK